MSVEWIWQAPCAGANPLLFETTDEQLAAQTISAYCNRCAFRAECIEHVDPRPLGFDGVCGGRLWRNGRVIGTKPDPRPNASCGSNAGYTRHIAAGERACPDCIDAHSAYNRHWYTQQHPHTDDELGEAV